MVNVEYINGIYVYYEKLFKIYKAVIDSGVPSMACQFDSFLLLFLIQKVYQAFMY